MNKKNKWQKNRAKKIIAAMVAFVFATTSSAWSVPVGVTDASTKVAVPQTLQASSIAIPEVLGEIQARFRSPKAEHTVVLIQDAHAVNDAQENIQKLIEYLQKNHGIQLVALEGGKEKLDPALYRAFPDAKVKQKVLTGYLNQAELTGPEMAAILSEKENNFYGIEDWGLYEQNYRAYLRAQEVREGLRQSFASFKQKLDAERKTVYSERLNDFHEAWEAFRSERTSLFELLLALGAFRSQLSKSSGYPELAKVVSSIGYEKSGKEKALEPMIRAMANEFKMKYVRELGVKEEMNFYTNYQAFSTGKMGAGQFLMYLVQAAKTKGFKPKLTPQMLKLLGHTETLSEIKGSRLFDELQMFLPRAMDSLVKKPEERNLAQKYQRLFILKNFAELELTHQELQAYEEEPEAFLNLLEDAGFRERIAPALEFYKCALDRDRALFDHLTALLKREGQKTAVMVAGGFHTQGLQKILRENGISYLVVTPKIQSLTGYENYARVMKGDVSYKPSKISTLYDAFARHATQKLMMELPLAGLEGNLKAWRDQLIRDAAEKGTIADVGRYTHYVDALALAAQMRSGIVPLKKNKEEVLAAIQKELNRFRDESLAEIWKRFESQLQEFATGLRKLVEQKDLNVQTVSTLLDTVAKPKPSMITAQRAIEIDNKSIPLGAEVFPKQIVEEEMARAVPAPVQPVVLSEMPVAETPLVETQSTPGPSVQAREERREEQPKDQFAQVPGTFDPLPQKQRAEVLELIRIMTERLGFSPASIPILAISPEAVETSAFYAEGNALLFSREHFGDGSVYGEELLHWLRHEMKRKKWWQLKPDIYRVNLVEEFFGRLGENYSREIVKGSEYEDLSRGSLKRSWSDPEELRRIALNIAQKNKKIDAARKNFMKIQKIIQRGGAALDHYYKNIILTAWSDFKRGTMSYSQFVGVLKRDFPKIQAVLSPILKMSDAANELIEVIQFLIETENHVATKEAEDYVRSNGSYDREVGENLRSCIDGLSKGGVVGLTAATLELRESEVLNQQWHLEGYVAAELFIQQHPDWINRMPELLRMSDRDVLKKIILTPQVKKTIADRLPENLRRIFVALLRSETREGEEPQRRAGMSRRTFSNMLSWFTRSFCVLTLASSLLFSALLPSNANAESFPERNAPVLREGKHIILNEKGCTVQGEKDARSAFSVKGKKEVFDVSELKIAFTVPEQGTPQFFYLTKESSGALILGYTLGAYKEIYKYDWVGFMRISPSLGGRQFEISEPVELKMFGKNLFMEINFKDEKTGLQVKLELKLNHPDTDRKGNTKEVSVGYTLEIISSQRKGNQREGFDIDIFGVESQVSEPGGKVFIKETNGRLTEVNDSFVSAQSNLFIIKNIPSGGDKDLCDIEVTLPKFPNPSKNISIEVNRITGFGSAKFSFAEEEVFGVNTAVNGGIILKRLEAQGSRQELRQISPETRRQEARSESRKEKPTKETGRESPDKDAAMTTALQGLMEHQDGQMAVYGDVAEQQNIQKFIVALDQKYGKWSVENSQEVMNGLWEQLSDAFNGKGGAFKGVDNVVFNFLHGTVNQEMFYELIRRLDSKADAEKVLGRIDKNIDRQSFDNWELSDVGRGILKDYDAGESVLRRLNVDDLVRRLPAHDEDEYIFMRKVIQRLSKISSKGRAEFIDSLKAISEDMSEICQWDLAHRFASSDGRIPTAVRLARGFMGEEGSRYAEGGQYGSARGVFFSHIPRYAKDYSDPGGGVAVLDVPIQQIRHTSWMLFPKGKTSYEPEIMARGNFRVVQVFSEQQMAKSQWGEYVEKAETSLRAFNLDSRDQERLDEFRRSDMTAAATSLTQAAPSKRAETRKVKTETVKIGGLIDVNVGGAEMRVREVGVDRYGNELKSSGRAELRVIRKKYDKSSEKVMNKLADQADVLTFVLSEDLHPWLKEQFPWLKMVDLDMLVDRFVNNALSMPAAFAANQSAYQDAAVVWHKGKLSKETEKLKVANGDLILKLRLIAVSIMLDHDSKNADLILKAIEGLNVKQLAVFYERIIGRKYGSIGPTLAVNIKGKTAKERTKLAKKVLNSNELWLSLWSKDLGIHGLNIFSCQSNLGDFSDPEAKQFVMEAVRYAILKFLSLDAETQRKIAGNPNLFGEILRESMPGLSFLKFNAEGLYVDMRQLQVEYQANRSVQTAA